MRLKLNCENQLLISPKINMILQVKIRRGTYSEIILPKLLNKMKFMKKVKAAVRVKMIILINKRQNGGQKVKVQAVQKKTF